MISEIEKKVRDSIIKQGYAECRRVIGKQKSRNMYFFYEGSLDGFDECRKMSKLEDFEMRIDELSYEEEKEAGRSALKGNSEETRMLREQLGIYDNNETDEDKLWKIKGMRTQIEYVYERLLALNCMINPDRMQKVKISSSDRSS